MMELRPSSQLRTVFCLLTFCFILQTSLLPVLGREALDQPMYRMPAPGDQVVHEDFQDGLVDSWIVALQPESGRIALTEPFYQAEPWTIRMPGHHNLAQGSLLLQRPPLHQNPVVGLQAGMHGTALHPHQQAASTKKQQQVAQTCCCNGR